MAEFGSLLALKYQETWDINDPKKGFCHVEAVKWPKLQERKFGWLISARRIKMEPCWIGCSLSQPT